MAVQKIAVIGSGVMGSGIAALAANAGVPVVLLDIVPNGATNRNQLTEGAIEKQLKSGGFTHPERSKFVTCGNLEDNLDLLKDCDWIIEAVIEKLEIKQSVYNKINAVKKASAVVSSNTSTIRLHELLGGLPEAFQQSFMIAHFFNPPRYMRLLEVVKSDTMPQAKFDEICDFADVKLGKEIVPCKDTAGFIGNRIGVYWMTVAMNEALAQGVDVETADAVMGRPAGFPSTGIFGLYDLIGIDLMPLIAAELLHGVPENDDFRALDPSPALMKKMIADGYTGRKGKGGFYRMVKDGETKKKEVLDLKTGEYKAVSKVKAACLEAGKKGLREMLECDDNGGRYARTVLLKTLHYAASLIPEISDDILAVDTAMKTGFSWGFGPFELIDKLGLEWFAEQLQKDGMDIPAIIAESNGEPLHERGANGIKYLTLHGGYKNAVHKPGILLLSDLRLTHKPVISNAAASLWDLGDGIACFEYTTKMNAADEHVMDMMEKSIDHVGKNFRGLVIGNDTENFCVGANLNVFLDNARSNNFAAVSNIVKRGQRMMMGLKYAPFPVVAALAGRALGGGCELALHANAIQAYVETTPGLVEINVGLIPGWGGCKEILSRNVPALAFEYVATATVATSADAAREMHILREGDAISMNRSRVLSDAKAKCLSMAMNYAAPAHAPIKTATKDELEAVMGRLNLTGHSVFIGKLLAYVFNGGGNATASEEELLTLEHEVFMEAIKTPESQARIEAMLKTGKPLKN